MTQSKPLSGSHQPSQASSDARHSPRENGLREHPGRTFPVNTPVPPTDARSPAPRAALKHFFDHHGLVVRGIPRPIDEGQLASLAATDEFVQLGSACFALSLTLSHIRDCGPDTVPCSRQSQDLSRFPHGLRNLVARSCPRGTERNAQRLLRTIPIKGDHDVSSAMYLICGRIVP